MDIKISLGERLKDLRVEKKLTQTQLSQEIEKKTGRYISRSTISEMEQYGTNDSKQTEPTLANLKAIADYFGVSMDFLIGEHQSKNIDIQSMHKMTGLSAEALEDLLRKKEKGWGFEISVLSELMLEPHFWASMHRLYIAIIMSRNIRNRKEEDDLTADEMEKLQKRGYDISLLDDYSGKELYIDLAKKGISEAVEDVGENIIMMEKEGYLFESNITETEIDKLYNEFIDSED